MTTLLSVTTGEGTRVCNSRCYDAEGKVCTCICGGRNHGVGENQARENTHEYAEELLAQWDNDDNDVKGWFVIPYQLPLLPFSCWEDDSNLGQESLTVSEKVLYSNSNVW